MCENKQPQQQIEQVALAINPELIKKQVEERLLAAGLTETDLAFAGYKKSDLFQFLESPTGSKLMEKILGLLDRFKGKNHWKSLLEMGYKLAIAAIVVGSVVYLQTLNKFDSSVGVLFGSIVGFIFARTKTE